MDRCNRCGSTELVTTQMELGPHYAKQQCKQCGWLANKGREPEEIRWPEAWFGKETSA